MPSRNIYEDELEQAALEWFEELGYETAFAPDISPGGDYPERVNVNKNLGQLPEFKLQV